MFFRRPVVRAPTFAERLDALRRAGFEVTALGGEARVTRGGFVAVVADNPARVVDAGPAIGGEIGKLVDRGYQKTFETPKGRQVAALASQLKELHAFLEDLRKGLGLTSMYHEALGTVNASHRYDRLERRDEAPSARPWER
jgi:hypothetical protein